MTGKQVKGDHMIHIKTKATSTSSASKFTIFSAPKMVLVSELKVLAQAFHILNCRIHEIRRKMPWVSPLYGTSPEEAISGLVIQGNQVFDCDPATSEAIVLNGNVDGFNVTQNLVHDVNNIGIDFIGGGGWD